MRKLLLVHVVVLADGRERHVARRRDLVLDDAQSVFPDELAEGPLDVKVRVEDAVRQGPLEALAVELRVVLHDLRDDGRAVVASDVVGGLRELAGDGLGPQRHVRVLGAGSNGSFYECFARIAFPGREPISWLTMTSRSMRALEDHEVLAI